MEQTSASATTLQRTSESASALVRAGRSIAGGVSSNVRLGGPQPPLFIARGAGAHIFDVDGNRYVDYALGMGPNVLGHAPPHVIDAVRESLAHGQLFAGTSPLESVLGEAIKAVVPTVELLRFGMSGSEMVQAALRVSRAFTGRQRFIKFEGHYHGWFDNVLVNHSNAPGNLNRDGTLPTVLQTAGQSETAAREAIVLPWNDIGAIEHCLQHHGNSVAAIIMEPVMCNSGVIPPVPAYLRAVRDLCNRLGIILIFDEVITGFRLAPGGAQEHYAVAGDLVVYAKAIGGGFPLAALGGTERVMRLIGSGQVNHSGTYNANMVSLAAGVATLSELTANDCAAFRRIETVGGQLLRGIKELADSSGLPLRAQGFPSVFNTFFAHAPGISTYAQYRQSDSSLLSKFLAALQARGIRPTGRGTWFLSAAHTQADVDRTLEAVRDTLADIGRG